MSKAWRNINGDYKVSSLGEVISLRMVDEVRLKETPRFGQQYVSLHIDGKYRSLQLKLLVAEAFIENPKKHKFIIHTNGDSTDNRAANLEWSAKMKTGRPAKTVTLTNPNGRKVTITNLNKYCKKHGLSQSGMSQVAKGTKPSYKGWVKTEEKR